MAYRQQWLASVVRAGCAPHADTAPECRQAWEASRSWGLRPARGGARHRSLPPGTATPDRRVIATWPNHLSPGYPASADPLNTIGAHATGRIVDRTAVVRTNRPRDGHGSIADIPHDQITRCLYVLEMETGTVRKLQPKQPLINACRGIHTALGFLSAFIAIPRRHDAEVPRRQRVLGEFCETRRMCFWRGQKHVNTPLRDARRYFRAAMLEIPSTLRTTVRVGRAVHHG